MRKLTRAAAVLCCSTGVMLAAGMAPAQARTPVDWSGTDVFCGWLHIGNVAIGMAHHLPLVYAWNTTPRRNSQEVALQERLLQALPSPQGGWTEVNRTDWYYARAWEDLPAQAWTSRTGTQLNNEQMQWTFDRPGIYQVDIRIWWGATRYMRSKRTGWIYPTHSPSPGADYCVFGG
jgi:hypothetical protein